MANGWKVLPAYETSSFISQPSARYAKMKSPMRRCQCPLPVPLFPYPYDCILQALTTTFNLLETSCAL